MKPFKIIETDVVVAGSGPGGATVARDLSRRGKRVVICEAGKLHKRFGNTFLLLDMMAGKGLTFSKEGTWVIRPKTVGGASMVFSGTAVRPPAWLKEKYGIDLQDEIKEIYEEIPIRPLPPGLIGPGATRIMESARSLGLEWNPLDKWIRPGRCVPNCGKCSLGCPREGAKWTAREYVEEARQNGARLLIRTRVDRVLTENGKATGVKAETPDGWIEVKAETVILSAGGQGTPPILQRSGVFHAGHGFFADPLWFVSGVSDVQGPLYDIPMSAGINMSRDGIVMTDFMLPPVMFASLLAYAGPDGMVSIPRLIDIKKTLTIMIKVRDGLYGRVNADESFSKPIDNDTWLKLNKGAVIAEDILYAAGVEKKTIIKTAVIASHPGGTVRIGTLLDKNARSPIDNCYCLDTSVITQPWGLPPTLTVVALEKRLAKHLTGPKEKPF